MKSQKFFPIRYPIRSKTLYHYGSTVRLHVFSCVGLGAVLLGAVIWGCSRSSLALLDASGGVNSSSLAAKGNSTSKEALANRAFVQPPARTRITNRPANVRGKVLILEYHHVLPKEDRWARSITNFKKDLDRLYKLGYRPITLAEYHANDFSIPPGSSPVVITFDDAHPNQFAFLEDGSIDPNCAVGIWKAFSERYPDFPVKGTWFIVPSMAFGDSKTFTKKMKMLEEWGSEIAVHTITHGSLGKMTAAQVQFEIGATVQFLEERGIKAKTVAYPYGVPPKDKGLIKRGVYKGKPYALAAGVLGGAGPARAARDPKVSMYSLPRIQAIEGDYGITFWLNKAKKNKFDLYVAP